MTTQSRNTQITKFDVAFFYHNEDRPQIWAATEWIRQQGLRPWLVTEFDVAFFYHNEDRPQIWAVAEWIRQQGLKPWLATEQIQPGTWFQDGIQEVISEAKVVAVFLGPEGLGRWQALELRASIRECVERGIRVIPVLLPGVDQVPKKLSFLSQLAWVNFKENVEEEALEALRWGITGVPPRRD